MTARYWFSHLLIAFVRWLSGLFDSSFAIYQRLLRNCELGEGKNLPFTVHRVVLLSRLICTRHTVVIFSIKSQRRNVWHNSPITRRRICTERGRRSELNSLLRLRTLCRILRLTSWLWWLNKHVSNSSSGLSARAFSRTVSKSFVVMQILERLINIFAFGREKEFRCLSNYHNCSHSAWAGLRPIRADNSSPRQRKPEKCAKIFLACWLARNFCPKS